VVLDNFGGNQLSNFLETFVEQSAHITDLSFENYTDAVSPTFNLKVDESSLTTLSFRSVHSPLLATFFNAVSEFNGRIRTLVLASSDVRGDVLAGVFQTVSSAPCFMQLIKLRIDAITVDPFPLAEFCAMLTKLRYLTTIEIASMHFEGADLLLYILPYAKALRHIACSRLRFTRAVESAIPDSVTSVDLTDCDVSTDTFVSLVWNLFWTVRPSPLFLACPHLAGEPTAALFRPLLANDSQWQSNIYELNWARNILSPADLQLLLSFVSKQPNLKHLDLSCCIVPSCQAGECLAVLADFLRTSPLAGLDIGCDRERPVGAEMAAFFRGLADGLPELKALYVENSRMADVDAFLAFVAASPALQEVAIDGFLPRGQDALVRLYSGLLARPRIRAIGTPKRDLEALGVRKETMSPECKKMLLALKAKKVPRTAAQRLAQVEAIDIEVRNVAESAPVDFESMLTVVEPAGVGKRTVPTSSVNSLTELRDRVVGFIAAMHGQPEGNDVDPIATARLIMRHLVTSKRALKVAGRQEAVT
jgi:hypothetical protein